MKSGIAGVLILLGLIGIFGSYFVGDTVDPEQDWSEDKVEEFSQLTTNMHVPNKGREVQQEERDRLMEMQQELKDVKEAGESKSQLFWIVGLCLTGVGLCFQGWDWFEKAKNQ